MKAMFYKMVGGGLLTWDELSDILLDIEITLNNRPLCYLEEDVQRPLLTPNSMLFLNANYLPEMRRYHLEDVCLRKRAKFLIPTKEQMWRRWTTEYLRALRERHRMKHPTKVNHVAIGDVVLIRSEDRNRNNWPMGIVERLFEGKDGVVRAVRLKSGRDRLERAIQHLYPLELSCDGVAANGQDGENVSQPKLNVEARTFVPKRKAAMDAARQIKKTLEDEHTE
jgi:hypothetical protein